MRRIDLACKLLGPLFIASLDAVSTRTAILANLCMNMLSIPVEYWCIAKVLQKLSFMKRSKHRSNTGL